MDLQDADLFFLIRNEWRLQHYEHSREGQFRCEKKPWPKWPNCGILPSENPEMGWYNVLMVGPDGSFGGVFFFFRIFEGPQNRQFHLVIVCSLWNHPCLFAADWKTNAEVPQVRMQKRQRNDSFTYSVEVPWSYGHIVSSIHPTASRVKIRQEKQWHKHREHLPKVSSSQFFLPSKWILTHFSNFHGLPPQKARPALPSCHEKRLCRHPVLRHHCHVSDRGRCWPPDRVRDAVSRTGAFSVSAEMAGNGTIVLFFMYQSL